jgi:hypothetical protein
LLFPLPWIKLSDLISSITDEVKVPEFVRIDSSTIISSSLVQAIFSGSLQSSASSQLPLSGVRFCVGIIPFFRRCCILSPIATPMIKAKTPISRVVLFFIVNIKDKDITSKDKKADLLFK